MVKEYNEQNKNYSQKARNATHLDDYNRFKNQAENARNNAKKSSNIAKYSSFVTISFSIWFGWLLIAEPILPQKISWDVQQNNNNNFKLSYNFNF